MRRVLGARLFWMLLGVLSAWLAVGVVRRGLARDPRFYARPQWQSVTGPAWGGADVAAPVMRRLHALGPVNLFDPAFETRVRSALAELPGVAEVGSIRRLWPRRYSVSVRLRRPCAVVRLADRDVPVTAGGVVLPERPYRRLGGRLLRIEGVEGPAPEPGRVWRDERLADGLVTVLQLARHRKDLLALRLTSVDVSGADRARRGVVLRGEDELTIRWGRPRATVGENPVETKIEFLRIAAPHRDRIRGFEYDVRFGSPLLGELPAP